MWETILQILQDNTLLSLAFLAWAWVVWHFGSRITNQLEKLATKISRLEYYHANRITKIESHLESHSEHNFIPYRNGDL